jgi:hypothetical protein
MGGAVSKIINNRKRDDICTIPFCQHKRAKVYTNTAPEMETLCRLHRKRATNYVANCMATFGQAVNMLTARAVNGSPPTVVPYPRIGKRKPRLPRARSLAEMAEVLEGIAAFFRNLGGVS